MHASRAKRRIGVLGTFVWDVIHAHGSGDERAEGWGGIAYALSAFDAALTDEWEVVPIVKVGRDLGNGAREFLATLRHVSSQTALVEVPEPNNRSELRYISPERRIERLSGGVPAWRWEELESRLEATRPDALYVNFLSGWELDLPTTRRVREVFGGPIYVDLHMLLWRPRASGQRELTTLPEAPAWYRCFDFVQVNEDEAATLAGDTTAFAEDALAAGVACAFVTLGSRGAAYAAAPGFDRLADLAGLRGDIPPEARGSTVVVPPALARDGPGVDPTGCGDVWGATCVSRLLLGDDVSQAVDAANRAAGLSAVYRGASGLTSHLIEAT